MKILIIGANGFTGRRILQDFSKNKEYKLYACSLHQDINPEDGYEFIQADICNENNLTELFNTTRPDIVINTSALSVPDYCETHHEEADLINTTAVAHLAIKCNEYNCRFIHLSTDFVFDGKSEHLYTEEDTPNPLNYYGKTKWEGEKRIINVCNDYAIVRVVVVYGKPLPGQHGNILQLVANRLRNGESINVVSDQWRTPTYVGDIANGIEKLMHHNKSGIYHICGGDNVSIADIAYKVAAHLQLDSALIKAVTTEEMQEITPRPRHSGLSIEKAIKEIGYQPLTLDEGIKETFSE